MLKMRTLAIRYLSKIVAIIIKCYTKTTLTPALNSSQQTSY